MNRVTSFHRSDIALVLQADAKRYRQWAWGLAAASALPAAGAFTSPSAWSAVGTFGFWAVMFIAAGVVLLSVRRGRLAKKVASETAPLPTHPRVNQLAADPIALERELRQARPALESP